MNAINAATQSMTQPEIDQEDVVDGLTETELRATAAYRLTSSVVNEMSVSELIDWYEATFL